jgi:hypothetical protein
MPLSNELTGRYYFAAFRGLYDFKRPANFVKQNKGESKMKGYTKIYLLMTALCFALAARAQEAEKAKPKLAVLPFQNKTTNPYWWHGGAEAAQDVFVTELMSAMQDVFVTELRNWSLDKNS